MCFSAEVSFTAAAILRAYKTDRRYIPIASLPVLFGLQQALEGAVWTSAGNQDLVAQFSLAYMFFPGWRGPFRIGAPVTHPAIVEVKLATRDNYPAAQLRPRVEEITSDALNGIPKLAGEFIAGNIAVY